LAPGQPSFPPPRSYSREVWAWHFSTWATREGCYDFKNIFAETFCEEIGIFLFKTKLKYANKMIITLVFEKSPIFSAENCKQIAENCDHNIDPQLYLCVCIDAAVTVLVSLLIHLLGDYHAIFRHSKRLKACCMSPVVHRSMILDWIKCPEKYSSGIFEALLSLANSVHM
jgi:hypothetical protein